MARKRGQAEVVGLLIIVVLLVFIGMIFLRFYLLNPPSTALSTARTSLETNNFLIAIMQTTLGQKQLTEHASTCYNKQSTCPTLQKDLLDIFSLVLKPGQKYAFMLKTAEKPFLELGNCETGIASTYSFVEDTIFYDATLKLC